MKILILICREQSRRRRHSSVLMPDGPATSLVFNATDRTSGSVICSYNIMTGWGSQGQGVRGDICGQINRFGFRVFQFQ